MANETEKTTTSTTENISGGGSNKTFEYKEADKSQYEKEKGITPEQHAAAVDKVSAEYNDGKLKTLLGEIKTPMRPERELKDERRRQKMSVLLDSLRLISDMGAATFGGNVYKRDSEVVEKSKKRENALLDAYRKSLDDYNELRSDTIKSFNTDKTNALKGLNDALGKYEKVTKTEKQHLKTGEKVTNNPVTKTRTTNTTTNKETTGGSGSGRAAKTYNADWDFTLTDGNATSKIVIPKSNINALMDSMIQEAATNELFKENMEQAFRAYGVTDMTSVYDGSTSSDTERKAISKIFNDYGIPANLYNAILPIQQATNVAFAHKDYEWLPEYNRNKWKGNYKDGFLFFTDNSADGKKILDNHTYKVFLPLRNGESTTWVKRVYKGKDIDDQLKKLAKELNQEEDFVKGNVKVIPWDTTTNSAGNYYTTPDEGGNGGSSDGGMLE